MLEILTVCTGNICRSPLAELVLRSRLDPAQVRVHSAGTRALVDRGMPDEAIDLAVDRGVSRSAAEAHRGRWLNEGILASPDLVLAMAREHRREVVELAPAKLRATFTVREFARLSAPVADDLLAEVAAEYGADPNERMRGLLQFLAGQRGMTEPPADPGDDDVIDPYRRSEETYELAGAQLDPALSRVLRVVGHALG